MGTLIDGAATGWEGASTKGAGVTCASCAIDTILGLTPTGKSEDFAEVADRGSKKQSIVRVIAEFFTLVPSTALPSARRFALER